MPDVGYGIGLSAQSTDRVEMLAKLAEKKSEYIADAKKKQEEYDAKKKDAEIGKLGADLDRIDYSKFDDLMQSPAKDAADKTYADLVNIATDSRTPEEITMKGSKSVNDLRAQLGALQVAGKNYQAIRTTDDSKLDYWGKIAKDAVNQKDLSKTKEIMNNAPASPFGNFYDPNTGAMAIPWVSKVDLSKEIEGELGKAKGVIATQVGSNEVLATKYNTYFQHIPETDAEAKKWADENHVGANMIPPSIESMSKAFVAAHPEGAQEWLHQQFMDADAYKANVKTYFNDDGSPKTDATAQGYQNFITNQYKQLQPQNIYKESGRPESQSSFGSGGYNVKEADKIYTETQQASDEALKVAKDKLDAIKSGGKHAKASKQQIKDAQGSYDTRQKENDDIKAIKAKFDDGDISFKEYTKQIAKYKTGGGGASDYSEFGGTVIKKGQANAGQQ